MDTVAISYRVADFLKQHPPFHAIDDADLIDLAARGRVRFYEANDFLLWQGEPHRAHVFVIQQGTVSVWDDADGSGELRDLLGAGDMLGVERFNGARHCLHSARAGSDVVIYTFPAEEFDVLLEKYPHARHYVLAHSGVSTDYAPPETRQLPHELFLYDLVKGKPLQTCEEHATVREVARRMTSGTESLVVFDREQRAQGTVTPDDLVAWIAGGGDPDRPIADLLNGPPATVSPDTSLTAGALMMAESRGGALVVTADGTPHARVHAIVTARDVAPVFGDQPVSILNDVDAAAGCADLAAINLRARRFLLRHLAGSSSFEWLARFAHVLDARIFRRIVALTVSGGPPQACWCVEGPAGRAESLTLAGPRPVLILTDDADRTAALAAYRAVLEALGKCGYLAAPTAPYEDAFYVCGVTEWTTRFHDWIQDPVIQEMYKARPLFDLRPVAGPQAHWEDVRASVREHVGREFLHVVANDCLANLPPLTFFQDAVVEDGGEFASVFRLGGSVLAPLVDVGRVFGLAAGAGLGCSTLERFDAARRLFADHDSIFRDAGETLRMVLWQQGRVGISRGTDGSEVPPAVLSRQDRHLLKSSFRSILRLVQFTADHEWIRAL